MMIKIQTFIFNLFHENTFVLSDPTGECIIVDAGCQEPKERELLEEYMREQNLTLVKLVNTHCHVDHLLGVKYLSEKFSVPFYIHEAEIPLLAHSMTQAEIFGFSLELPPDPGGFLNQGDKLQFGESTLDVIHVPGHSPGGIVLYNKTQKFMLAGDVLFQGSIGRTDLPGGNYDSLVNGIRNKLLVLDPDTRVYSGHGPSTSIGEEKKSNPFFS